MEKIKAVALMSGGLDSMLAAKVMEKLGIEVLGINFYTGFCITEQRRRVDGSQSAASRKKIENAALKSAAEIEIPVEIVDISKDYLEMVTNPRHGYGANVNPCIDCRIHMLREAHAYMLRTGAKFIVTGEVVGQRPMSQHKNTMRMIEKQAGVAGIVLRPLSAKLLEPTVAETSGWVRREDLYAIAGRGRQPQMRLARELGIGVFPNPGGGCCFLTDQTYAQRFFDLMRHREKKELTMEDVVRLRLGRHFRVKEGCKFIIGRNEAENDLIEKYAGDGMAVLKATVEKGPVCLMEGAFDEDDIRLAAALTAGYGKARTLAEVEFEVRSGGGTRMIIIKPAAPEEYSKYLIQHRP